MATRLVMMVLCGIVASACSAAETPGIGEGQDVSVNSDDVTGADQDTATCLADTDCDDGNACTSDDVCTDGVCVGEAMDCEDDNECTTN